MTEKPDEEMSVAENSEDGETQEDPLIEPEVLEKLPPEAKKILQVGMAMHRVGPMPNPIAAKVNEGHITQALENAEKEDERWFDDRKETRKLVLICIFIFVALFCFPNDFSCFKRSESIQRGYQIRNSVSWWPWRWFRHQGFYRQG